MAQPKKVKSVCVPLDPDDCGSVIHGYVRFPELVRKHYGSKDWYVECGASLSLSDCNRIIQWAMTDGNDDAEQFNVAKLDVAIGALTKFREYMAQANAEYKRLEKEAKERNKGLSSEG